VFLGLCPASLLGFVKQEIEMDEMQKEMNKWIAGEVISDLTDYYGTRFVICKNSDGYSAIRGFLLGDGVAVSADKQDVTADEMIRYLAILRTGTAS
jgi:hypothetical protein